MSSPDFREEYAKLLELKEKEPEAVQAALEVLNAWGTHGPLLLYVAEGLKRAHALGAKGRPLKGTPGRARPSVSISQKSSNRLVRVRPPR